MIKSIIKRRDNLEKARANILLDVYKENAGIELTPLQIKYRKNQIRYILVTLIALIAVVLYFIYAPPPMGNKVNDVWGGFSYSPLNRVLTDKEIQALEQKGISPEQYRSFIRNAPVPLRSILGLKVKTIVIDPGHGGEDPGTIGKMGTMEKDITLDIAKTLRKKLFEYPGYKIILTREGDETISPEERVVFAKKNKTDLFISIHVNYIPAHRDNVIETFYFGSNPDKQTLELAEKENQGSKYTISDLQEITQRIQNTLKTQESKKLAYFIQKSLYRHIKKTNVSSMDLGIKPGPFLVLLDIDVPSVLTEVSCMSNPLEEKKMRNPEYRREIAEYLEEGIVKYLKQKNNISEVSNGFKRISKKR